MITESEVMDPDREFDIQTNLEALVSEYGLPDVYNVLRSFPGYCGNCGTPLTDGIPHQPGNLCMCYSERPSKHKASG